MTTKESILVSGSKYLIFTKQLSITNTMFGIVIEVSAILVATIIFPIHFKNLVLRLLIGVDSNIFIYLSVGRLA